MALRKLFTKRLFNGSKTTMPSTTLEHRIVSSPPLQQARFSPNHREYLASPDSADKGFFRRFFLRRAVYHSGHTRLPEFLSIPVGEKLREKLKGINNIAGVGDRLKLGDVNLTPVPAQSTGDSVYGNGISVKDARKILRASQVEKVKAKLRDIPESSICYSEFLRICVESCQNHDQGVEFAKILDDCGNVIVLGNVVFLRPEQVAKTMESLIDQSIAKPNDPRRKELEQMERQKAMIDDKAKAQVRAELYCGLGFLMVQTLGFMRLTFWELSWDVMEPICFFVTSIHFALAYLFFMRTSTEPTFQGYFYRRFKAKQERLMKTYNFDIHRYNELYRACYPSYHSSAKSEPSSPFHHSEETLLRAMHR
ncbi:calcium uniporter protein 4, mitochondrial-like [Gastrolobium bilobum]|uniref:calcium uniporter protein 4, mitochondrial-like n=1 Tax=Gastrolobium bilobum TaxID=150636 RepID=UPI002AB262CD|nr:calcium uniporter protein 4, mitochondrial-like [Gastrolobium bilobum]